MSNESNAAQSWDSEAPCGCKWYADEMTYKCLSHRVSESDGSPAACTCNPEVCASEAALLRNAGNALAEAAHRISTEYDGVHRLRLALAGWYTALANEGGRGV